MSAHSSSSNDSHLSLHFSISPTNCLLMKPFSFIFTTFSVINILILLPLCIFIVHLGLQQRRKNSSTSSAATSHSDCFTYHVSTMELIGAFGGIICSCGYLKEDVTVANFGNLMYSFTWYGQILFHALTCVERYLAVVHPITYMRLRNQRGVRIRNISIGCAWLLSLVGVVLVIMNYYIVLDFCILLSALLIVSFCSFSVLCVLIRPGPGEQGGDRERVDQMKRRAFYTMVAILGVLVIRFALGLLWAVIFLLTGNCDCLTFIIGIWIILPSSLVLPVLFLHRAGKLACSKTTT